MHLSDTLTHSRGTNDVFPSFVAPCWAQLHLLTAHQAYVKGRGTQMKLQYVRAPP